MSRTGTPPCAECGYWMVHQLSCQSQTTEERLKKALSIIEANEMRAIASLATRERQRKEITFWQGKFQVLKHENNVLRRRLYRQEKTNAKEAINEAEKEGATIQ